MNRKTNIVTIYTDGACKFNPGPGGWGALLRFKGVEKEIHGGEAHTTNNRMELLAAINALRALKRPSRVRLYTDSQYVQLGVLSWLEKWKANRWRNSDRKPVKNRDLWEELDALRTKHDIAWHWVRGHDGNPGNERADALAHRAISGN